MLYIHHKHSGDYVQMSEECGQMNKRVPAGKREDNQVFRGDLLKKVAGFSSVSDRSDSGCYGFYDAPRPEIPPRRLTRFRYV
jgi:hypothetical protein